MARSVRVRVAAKINLSLGVGAVRADGFHELATVYQALSLFDYVDITDRGDGRGLKVRVAGRESATVPQGEENLAWKAAALVGAAFGRPVDLTIEIDKGIPVAGGMAGGSADAAGVLHGLATLWAQQSDNPEVDLGVLAAELGSDVPFALVGGTAVGMGRGERIVPAMTSGEFHWVLALSDGQLSTPEVYAKYDELAAVIVAHPAVNAAVLRAVRAGDAKALGSALDNDLQTAAVSLMPPLQMLLDLGPEHGALGTMVSGSGPTCGFLVADQDAALELAVALSSSGLCRAVRRAVGPVAGATVVAPE